MTESTPESRIYVVFTLGTKLRVDSRAIARLLTHPQVVLFILLAVTLFAFLNPFEPTTTQPLYMQFVIWTSTTAVYILALYLIAVVFEHAWRSARPALVYSPPVMFVALLGSESYNYWFHYLFLEMPAEAYPGLIDRVLLQLPIVLIFEVIFIKFVAAHIMELDEATREWNWRRDPDARSEPTPPPAPDPVEEMDLTPVPDRIPPCADHPPVDLDGRMFPPETILLITAQEHYIMVRTAQREIMLRENISRAVSKLPEALGMRAHRSYWVAFAFARAVQRQGAGKYGVILDDGQTIPLSRALRSEFETRLREAGALRPGGTIPEPDKAAPDSPAA